jgi:tetratricopeptide (TPR) repeat protein
VPAFHRRKNDLVCILITIILATAAYSNTLQAPFIFDDSSNIVGNMSIRSIWPSWKPLFVSSDTGLTGRSLINFSLAFNYAISGDNVWSYHLLNLLIHILAALTLWGIIRRTLENQHWDINKTWNPAWIALGCTLVWALHPLQTQAVTYLSQRCESLMGLFFLLVLYCAVRGWQSPRHHRAWHLLAILSFVAGAGCKEVIAAAPPLVLLYDWVFNRKSPAATIRSSSFLYTGLLLCLVGEFLLVAAGGTTSAGTEKHTFTLLDYWLLQPPIILHYIRLVFWPSNLALDYGMDFHGMIETWPALAIVIVLIVVSLWLLLKRRPAGFLMAWFFLILVPTSLFPLPDVAFEHRMYLPSIAIIVLTICGLYQMGLLMIQRFAPVARHETLTRASLYFMILIILAAAISTYARNLYYRTAISIWADNVVKRPQGDKAQNNLGHALLAAGRPIDAIYHLQQAIYIMESQPAILNPWNYANTISCLGGAYLAIGQGESAEYCFRKSLQIQPNSAYAETNLGRTLFTLKRNDEARLHFRRAILIDPNYAEAHSNYGVFLRVQGNLKDAEAQFLAALQLKPNHIEANVGMGLVLYLRGQFREAQTFFQKALTERSDNEFVRNMLIELDKKLNNRRDNAGR